MRIRSMLFGGLVGAALAYLFDPVAGRGRRTRLRDQAMAMIRRGSQQAERRTRYVVNMAQGRVAEMGSKLTETREADDATILQRIRSEVFGSADVPQDRISLEVVGAVATIRGELDSREEIDELRRRVAAVDGVLHVEMLVHLPGEPAPNKEPAIRASREIPSPPRS
jgi:osmotically-inducible protein OsmY